MKSLESRIDKVASVLEGGRSVEPIVVFPYTTIEEARADFEKKSGEHLTVEEFQRALSQSEVKLILVAYVSEGEVDRVAPWIAPYI